MTGYTVHTGTSMKFSAGWDRVFQAAKSKKATKGTETPTAIASEKSPKKGGKKKSGHKKRR